MLVVVVLSKEVQPFILDLVMDKKNVLIAAKPGIASVLKEHGINTDIEIPEDFDFLKSLAYTDTNIIRYEYNNSTPVKNVLVFGPCYEDSKVSSSNIRNLNYECHALDFFVYKSPSGLNSLVYFYCSTFCFRLLSQAYKFDVVINGIDASKHKNIADNARILSFIAQTKCLIKTEK